MKKDTAHIIGTFAPAMSVWPLLNAIKHDYQSSCIAIFILLTTHMVLAMITDDALWFARRSLWRGKGFWMRFVSQSKACPLIWEKGE